MKDPNVEHIRRLLAARSRRGFAKYGTTTDRKDLTFDEWCQHAIEEALDFAIYLRVIQKQGRHANTRRTAPRVSSRVRPSGRA